MKKQTLQLISQKQNDYIKNNHYTLYTIIQQQIGQPKRNKLQKHKIYQE